MGVRILFGSPPSPPPVLSAEVLRGLRAPDGSRPCRVGLDKALRWIGDREISIEQALEEAQSVLASSDLEWGRGSLGVSGYGCGDGSSYGDGDGSGYGCGYSYGCGDGSGSGPGDGYGSGYGSGDGSGYGDYGSGYDYGCGFGNGYGYGSSCGDGYSEGYGYGEEIR